ncbi:hypothetical protein B0H15DRAFT_540001 [Mycena belliarum]|uniref:Uncharacterized protein n=1 Tax=Mycena belliarum TaxID=1033014 RepID=A0AAD6TXQ1_9AGAR|nr:hypothetical protein B0H15DRAFT_540001 [Mycena belliae]
MESGCGSWRPRACGYSRSAGVFVARCRSCARLRLDRSFRYYSLSCRRRRRRTCVRGRDCPYTYIQIFELGRGCSNPSDPSFAARRTAVSAQRSDCASDKLPAAIRRPPASPSMLSAISKQRQPVPNPSTPTKIFCAHDKATYASFYLASTAVYSVASTINYPVASPDVYSVASTSIASLRPLWRNPRRLLYWVRASPSHPTSSTLSSGMV